jgi:EmrB/QacA subfamily drug resistance transporter
MAPEQVRRDPKVLTIISCLTLALFVAALDQTVVATALPSIMGELGGLTHLPWVVTAYTLSICLSTPLYGKLGDLFGHKRLYLLALVLFLAGSVLCGLAGSLPELIAFRFLQGSGAGGMIVGSWAIIGTMLPPAAQGRYQGLTQSAYALATACGPAVGGVLTEALNWRWIFYLNIPLCLITLITVAVKLRLPEWDRPKPVIDWWGVVLVSAGIGSLVLLVTLGGNTFPWLSAPAFGLAAATLALLAAAVAVERKVRQPLLPPHLFSNKVIRIVLPLAFILGAATQAGATFMPLFQQIVDGASPASSGLRMTPFWVVWSAASAVCGRAIGQFGHYRRFPIFGNALVAAGMVILSFMDGETPFWWQAVGLAVIGIGLGMLSSVMVLAAQNAVGSQDVGLAISTTTFVRTFGGLLGVATFGTIFTAVLASSVQRNLPAGFSPDGMSITRAKVDALPADLRAQLLGGFETALHGVFLAAAVIAVVGILIAPRLPGIPLRTHHHQKPETERLSGERSL